jgi:hypothetical protein
VTADKNLFTTLGFSGCQIKDKCNNIRDAFFRSLIKKGGQSATIKYLYADFLQFLLKVNEKDETESSILGENMTESTETQAEEETAVQEIDEASTSSRDAETLQRRRRKASQVDEIYRRILKSLEENST